MRTRGPWPIGLLAVLALVAAALWLVRRDLPAIVLMVVGLLAFSAGLGFVLAGLRRTRYSAGFVVGLLATAGGAVTTVLGLYELVRRAAS